MLWSLGLHITAFAASYSWWSSPITHVSFAGNRYAIQLEAAFSEMPSEQEIETVLEFESLLPPEDLSPTNLPLLERELVVVPATLQLPDIPLQDSEFIEDELPQSVFSSKEPHEAQQIKVSKKEPRRQLSEPSMPEAITVEQQFAGADEQTPPDLSANRPPRYPTEAIRRHWEGVVLLRLSISASGKVERVEVVQSSGYALLDSTAVEAVRTWHARPAEQNGKPVATTELLPIRFKI